MGWKLQLQGKEKKKASPQNTDSKFSKSSKRLLNGWIDWLAKKEKLKTTTFSKKQRIYRPAPYKSSTLAPFREKNLIPSPLRPQF